MREENSESTSYGVARLPYTTRLAKRWTRSRTGWKATATTAVARMERPRLGFDPCPIAAPMPTTIPTYTAVMNPARAENTTVLLMTTSMSYRRYLRMATPTAMGRMGMLANPRADRTVTFATTMVRPGRSTS